MVARISSLNILVDLLWIHTHESFIGFADNWQKRSRWLDSKPNCRNHHGNDPLEPVDWVRLLDDLIPLQIEGCVGKPLSDPLVVRFLLEELDWDTADLGSKVVALELFVVFADGALVGSWRGRLEFDNFRHEPTLLLDHLGNRRTQRLVQSKLLKFFILETERCQLSIELPLLHEM